MSGIFTEVLLSARDTCEADNEYDGQNWGARISAVFVILVTSAIGAFLPILSSRYSFIRMPSWCFFIAKYFGSGVIVATAFIHLLEPASDSLGEECLGSGWTNYPWAFGIALITLFMLFFFEICAYQFVELRVQGIQSENSHSHFGDANLYVKKEELELENKEDDEICNDEVRTDGSINLYPKHFQHAAEHQDPEAVNTPVNIKDREQYYGQLLSVFVLEFGVIFHSVFVGLSLSVAGPEFKSLYIVLVFHQMFEGLGLGTRIATAPWPKSKRFTPWLLAAGYSVCTPIAIAIGLGVRQSYAPGSRTALITNGIFDSISAGILFYTGIVELMAHEFLYSGEFKGKGGFKKMLLAYVVLCFGAGLMALLGRWA
ncbi:uncharacterized protein PRCAT00003898001 [Priceomyces carsonii]|uniref:uncharacterized protein n=1 Tax=Priceomyces carsonii TaxID=28549 RepID=UPI002ED86A92|nr:unnamed protein product [Priceomyces carsonii]